MDKTQLNNLESLEGKQLVLRITGSVEQSNLAEFEQQAMTVIAGINLVLETDEQFAEAESSIKSCKLMEDRIATARGTALVSTKAIAELIQTTERLEAKFRETRLLLNNKVRTEKDRRVSEIMNGARNRLAGLVINSPVKHGFAVDNIAINAAAKGKRSLAKMQAAVDAVVESEELRLANMEADFSANLELIDASEAEWPGLFPDRLNLALSAKDTVSALIQGRIADHRFKVAEKARKDKEESDRLAAEKLRKEQDRTASPGPETHLPPTSPVPQDSAWQPPSPPMPSFTHPLDMPPLPPAFMQWKITVTTNTEPTLIVDAISAIPGVVEVASEEI